MRHRVAILATSLLFSTGGAAIKATSLTSWQVSSLRSLVAAITLLLLLPATRRGYSWRSWVVGAAYACTVTTFVWANKLTTAANTIFLQSSASLYLLILGPLLLREPVRRRELGFAVAMIGGLVVLMRGDERAFLTAPDPELGNWIAVASGIGWAGTILGLRWLAKRESASPAAAQMQAVRAVVCGNVLAFLIPLPWALPLGSWTATDAMAIGYLGVFQIGLAYALLTSAIAHLTALEVALLMLIEPVLNPLWAFILHGEAPSVHAWFGGLVILGCVAAQAMAPASPAHTR